MGQEHKEKRPARSEEDAEHVEPQAGTDVEDSDVDDILDEIDDVLEENSEAFVLGFVQKGGE